MDNETLQKINKKFNSTYFKINDLFSKIEMFQNEKTNLENENEQLKQSINQKSIIIEEFEQNIKQLSIKIPEFEQFNEENLRKASDKNKTELNNIKNQLSSYNKIIKDIDLVLYQKEKQNNKLIGEIVQIKQFINEIKFLKINEDEILQEKLILLKNENNILKKDIQNLLQQNKELKHCTKCLNIPVERTIISKVDGNKYYDIINNLKHQINLKEKENFQISKLLNF